ncbi:MAG: hypothetical protein COT85_03970 [Chlamydiae bacterium CG10_big_fil_rev_8_21_14_0_10_42_34]|nr:MAG: hypothetical protein COT85_03970 [Chlamydiae bacterium CG10_big_fil_rev_8_21_14_0_10_42_34]
MYYFLILSSLLILPFKIFSDGRLIEVCGIDGSGKSTFIQDMKDALTEKGRKVIVLKPLSGDPAVYKFLDELDALKANTADRELHERIDRFKSEYFFLGMLNHKPLIDRYISEGYDVLCDRYIFSYKTYQECFDQSLKEDETLLSQLPKEKITFLLTAPVEVAMSRIEAKGAPASYENPVFLGKAQEIFLREANHYPHLVHLNGNGTRQSNLDEALSVLEER